MTNATSAGTTPQPGTIDGFVPFPAERANAYRQAGFWAGRTVDSVLRDAAARHGDSPAVSDATATLSFRDLDTEADRAAYGFARMGLAPGERVLLQLPNRNTFAVALFGALRAGLLPVMCLPGHRAAELSHFVEVSGAATLVIADSAGGFDYLSMATALAAKHPSLRHIVVDGDPGTHTAWSDLMDGPASAPEIPPINTAAPAVLLVSGGTTGAPKLIPRTHDDYVFNAVQSAAVCGLGAEDVYLVALPAGHNFPLACPGLLGAVSVGATTVFTTDPSPESAFATIAQHGVTVTSLVPSLAQLWALATEWEPVQPDSLRLVQVGGARLNAADARNVREKLTAGLQQVFGMAEGLVCFTRPGDPAEILDNTQGRPLSESDEIRIVDEDGKPVPAGEVGELLVRGPYTLNGYFRAEADNARAFTPDGFYRSGDQVRQLPGGYLEVTGRIKDVIVRGGESIAALDVESHLQAHPSVFAAAAVGLPDQYLGELVCVAAIFNGSPATVSELNEFLGERGVATHVRIDKLVAVSSLPKTAVGKIDKRALAATLADG